MFRNKLLPILCVILLMTAVSFTAAASERVPEDRINSETARYRTAEVVRGDSVNMMYSSADIYLPVVQSVYYDGAEAVFRKASSVFGSDVDEKETVFQIEPNVDTIHIEELRLKKEELAQSFENAEASRSQALKKLWEEFNSASAVGDPYTATMKNLEIQRANIEEERAAYQYEKQVAAIDKELEELDEQMKTTKIDAPISGRITWIQHYTEGQTIPSGQHVFSITDLTKIYLRTSASIRSGLSVIIEISVRGDDYEVPGKCVVDCQEQSGGAKSGSIIEIDAEALANFMEEMGKYAGNIRILDSRAVGIRVHYAESEMKNILMVPEDALVKDGSIYYAEILDENNAIHRRPVKAVVLKDHNAWILSGLSEGDTVVLQ